MVKFIMSDSIDMLEKKVNDFIKDKDVIDINFNSTYNQQYYYTIFTVLILYKKED